MPPPVAAGGGCSFVLCPPAALAHRHIARKKYLLIRRLCSPAIYDIFPTYSGYQPLGVMQGVDLPPAGEGIFFDGFESGDLSRWSAVVG